MATPPLDIPTGIPTPPGETDPSAPARRRHGHSGRTRRAVRWLAPAAAVGLLGAATLRFLDDPVPDADRLGVTTPVRGIDVIAGLEAAVSARPDDPATWQQLGNAYVTRAAHTGDASYGAQAADAFDRADALAPGATATTLGRASLALTRHRFDEARTLAAEVLAQRPANPEALAVLVDASVELGRYDDAQRYGQQLLDVRPGVAAFTRAAYLRELHGDLDGALAAMVQAEAAAGGLDATRAGGDARPTGTLATVVALQGDVLFASGRADEAAQRYRRALELADDLTVASVGLARADAAAGRVEEAEQRLQALLERSPTLSAAILLGDVQRLAGRPATGDELVDVIAQLQRAGGASVELELAVHLADRGRPDVELARAAYDERPSVYGADALGWSLTRAGRAAEALPYVRRSLALGSADAGVHTHAALALHATGDEAAAADALRRAFAENPHVGFGLRGELGALATSLGVAVPPAWPSSAGPS